VESLLARPAGYIRDHVQCVPKWRLLAKFTQITALSAEVCITVDPSPASGRLGEPGRRGNGRGSPGVGTSPRLPA
jgi:hypothetical protein